MQLNLLDDYETLVYGLVYKRGSIKLPAWHCIFLFVVLASIFIMFL
jgi:hypothetical protein